MPLPKKWGMAVCVLVSQGLGDTCCSSLCSWLVLTVWRGHPCVSLCSHLLCSADTRAAPWPGAAAGAPWDWETHRSCFVFSAGKQRVPQLFEHCLCAFGVLLALPPCTPHPRCCPCLCAQLRAVQPVLCRLLCHPPGAGATWLKRGCVSEHLHAGFTRCPWTTLRAPCHVPSALSAGRSRLGAALLRSVLFSPGRVQVKWRRQRT